MLKRKKPDEMELEIRNKSIIVSQRFTEIVLVIWVIACLVTHRSCLLPAYVLAAQLAVRLIASIIYKRQVGDDRWKNGIIILLTVIAAVIFILLLIPFFLIGAGEAE